MLKAGLAIVAIVEICTLMQTGAGGPRNEVSAEIKNRTSEDRPRRSVEVGVRRSLG